jgi:predicted ATPase
MIFNLVVTGGPCGGKTTALKTLESFFTKRGFKVLTIPETATEVMNSGIIFGEIPTVDFQEIIFERMICKENTARRAARLYSKDVIIFYDRALLDVKAYMSADSFKKVLKKFNMTEKDILDRYDAVFHLLTAADGAEKYYTLENNKTRYESAEKAIEVDLRTQDAWKEHPKFKLIDNSTGFRKKLNKLTTSVNDIINI